MSGGRPPGDGSASAGAAGQTVRAAWDAHAHAWARWARPPELDVFFWQFNWPTFATLVPPPGRGTLDLGCGEGRTGRLLAEAGHRVTGVDGSPALAGLAREAGGYEEVAYADAVALPWPDGRFDCVVAFMVLHDLDDPATALREAARVLAPGGVMCAAIVHPLKRDADGLERYFEGRRIVEAVERDGVAMTFEGYERPLERYAEALADAGFAIERLREPRPSAADVAREPRLARAAQLPHFLHLRCRR